MYTYRLIVSDYRRPWTPATSELSQVRWRPFGDGEMDGGGVSVLVSGPHTLSKTQRRRYFMPVFYEAVLSLQSSRPEHAEAWLIMKIWSFFVSLLVGI